MSKVTITLSIPESVKLLSMCNTAINSEQKLLKCLSDNSDDLKVVSDTKESVQEMLDIKNKLKSAMVNIIGS